VNKEKNINAELKIIDSLLKDKQFAEQMAMELEASYYKGIGEAVPPFLIPGEDSLKIDKSVKEEKIAINLAGFYALECATNYLVTTSQKSPSEILQSLIDDKISKEDKLLFACFANATWKAGQPFRGLDRITRETFTPFSFLREADIEKDLVQVKAAAKKLLEAFK
jgi:hypothetical protein